jgi:hypothetical protein
MRKGPCRPRSSVGIFQQSLSPGHPGVYPFDLPFDLLYYELGSSLLIVADSLIVLVATFGHPKGVLIQFEVDYPNGQLGLSDNLDGADLDLLGIGKVLGHRYTSTSSSTTIL